MSLSKSSNPAARGLFEIIEALGNRAFISDDEAEKVVCEIVMSRPYLYKGAVESFSAEQLRSHIGEIWEFLSARGVWAKAVAAVARNGAEDPDLQVKKYLIECVRHFRQGSDSEAIPVEKLLRSKLKKVLRGNDYQKRETGVYAPVDRPEWLAKPSLVPQQLCGGVAFPKAEGRGGASSIPLPTPEQIRAILPEIFQLAEGALSEKQLLSILWIGFGLKERLLVSIHRPDDDGDDLDFSDSTVADIEQPAKTEEDAMLAQLSVCAADRIVEQVDRKDRICRRKGKLVKLFIEYYLWMRWPLRTDSLQTDGNKRWGLEEYARHDGRKKTMIDSDLSEELEPIIRVEIRKDLKRVPDPERYVAEVLSTLRVRFWGRKPRAVGDGPYVGGPVPVDGPDGRRAEEDDGGSLSVDNGDLCDEEET